MKLQYQKFLQYKGTFSWAWLNFYPVKISTYTVYLKLEVASFKIVHTAVLLGHLIVVVIVGGVGGLELEQLYPDHPLLLFLGHEPRTIRLHLVQVLAAPALARSL